MIGEELDLRVLHRHRADLVEVCVAAADTALPADRAGRAAAVDLRTVVPRLLPRALRAMETGRPLTAGELHPLRAAVARRAAGPAVPLPAVLGAMGPALAVFADAVRSDVLDLPDRARPVVLARAAGLSCQMTVVIAAAWPGDPAAPDEELEPEDRAMLRLLARGASTAEIARATAYSPQAVAWRLGRLMRRWAVANRPALVAAAYDRGVLTRRRRTGCRSASPR